LVSSATIPVTAVRIPLVIPAATGRPFDVVGLGLNSIDLVAVLAEFPSGNSKQRLQRFSRQPGGQTAGALVTCARLGWGARYLGTFGDDEFGRLARQSLIDEGVDVDAARVVAGATNQFAIVLVDARSGERTVLWDRHPLLTMTPADVRAEDVTSGRVLLVDCHETAAATEAARQARAAGMATILDVERVRPGIGELLQQCDVIIAAEEFPCVLTGYEQPGHALAAIAREYGAAVVCVTLGAQGSLARANGREIRTLGFAVDCVDSTGAGDVFRGGFAAACLRWPEGDLEDALTYANAVAALNCRALGARSGIPTTSEVDRLLAMRA
jgi:sulfofructose kinase